MTVQDFCYWLQGYADAKKQALSAEDVEFVIEKLRELSRSNSVQLSDLFFPEDRNVCIDGAPHAYPSTWFGIVPPPCVKCGMVPPSVNTTSTAGI